MYLFSYGKSVSQIGCSGVVGQTGLLFTLASLPVPGAVVRPNFRCAFYLRPRAFHPTPLDPLFRLIAQAGVSMVAKHLLRFFLVVCLLGIDCPDCLLGLADILPSTDCFGSHACR